MKLSLREVEIGKLLVTACPNKEIATQLGICQNTVKQHMHSLYLRFGIVSGVKRVKLAVYLYRKYPEWR